MTTPIASLRSALPPAGAEKHLGRPGVFLASRRLATYTLLTALAWVGMGYATEAPAQEAAPAEARTAPSPLPAFEVTIRDGRFTPERIEVPAGRKIRINLRNDGPGPLEFENSEMHVEKVLGAGASSFVVLQKLDPGEYSFTDEFNPVTGNLTVIAK